MERTWNYHQAAYLMKRIRYGEYIITALGVSAYCDNSEIWDYAHAKPEELAEDENLTRREAERKIGFARRLARQLITNLK